MQESVEVWHVGNLEWLKAPKNNIKETMTFHNGEQNIEDATKNIVPKIVLPTKNHPPKNHHPIAMCQD